MSYLNTLLVSNEKLIAKRIPHWIIFNAATLWFLITIVFFIGGKIVGIDRYTMGLPLHLLLSILGLVCSVYFALSSFIIYHTTEYGLTERRVLIKRGLFRITSNEILLHRIESIRVFRSIPGRIFGYGNVIITGTGGSADIIQEIPQAPEFRTHIQEQIDAVMTETSNAAK